MLDNRKTRYTHRVIKETFIELLSEKSVGKITVKKICEIADISKGAFYQHFENIGALQNELENDILGNIRNIFSSKKITSNVLIIDTIVKDVHEHKKLYKPLLCTTPGSPFIKRFASLLLELSMETNQEMNFYADMTKEEMLYAIVVFMILVQNTR